MAAKCALVWFVVFNHIHLHVIAQSCGGAAGPAPVAAPNSLAGSASEIQYLMYGDGVIPCYGFIQSWTFYFSGLFVNCYSMRFQVWRPTSGSQYMLIGENTCNTFCNNVLSPQAFTYTLPTGSQLQVQPNDIIGWVDINPPSTSRDIEYSSSGAGMYGPVWIQDTGAPCERLSVGAVCDWSTATVSNRQYSLQVTLIQGMPPQFSDLAATTYIYCTVAAGQYIYTARGWNDFASEPIVPPDLTYGLGTVTSAGGVACAFSIDPTSGVITSTAAIPPANANNGPGGVTVTCLVNVNVWDDPSKIGTQKLSLVVQRRSIAQPKFTFTNLPSTIPVTAVTAAGSLTCRDIPDGSNVKYYTETETETEETCLYALCHPTEWPPASMTVYTVRLTIPGLTPPDTSIKVVALKYDDPYDAPFTVTSVGNTAQVQTTAALANWQSPLSVDLYFIAYDDTSATLQYYYDEGTPQDLNIVISNIRTPPIITNLDATVSIPETTGAGTTIYTVTDTVDVRGQPGTFNILDVYPQDTPGGTFTIIATSGVINVVTAPPFDYFGVQQYEIEVQVVDTDSFFSSEPKNLSVLISWVDQPPVFQSTAYTASIDEQYTGYIGVTLNATDRDVPVGDYVTYSVAGNPVVAGMPLLAVDSSGRVYVTSPAELPPSVSSTPFAYTATAYDSYGESVNVPLTVTLSDINDHAPVFTSYNYTGSVQAGSPGGTATGVTVTATDADAGNNAAITYSLAGKDANLYFQVGPTSGVITTKQPITWSDYPNMTFEVVATDDGDPPLNGTATVYIQTLATNQMAPQFSPGSYNLEVASNQPVASQVVRAQARDNDSGADGTVYYYFLDVQYDFRIDSSSGNISVATGLSDWMTYLDYVNAHDLGQLTELYSQKPCFNRIDTYDARTTLVNIYLNVPLATFVASEDQFLSALNALLAPWTVKIQGANANGGSTVATIYALSETASSWPTSVQPKVFVNNTALLAQLRTDPVKGSPNGALQGADFAEWQPTEVQPTYPDFLTQTPGGIALLCIICAVGAAGVITGSIFLAKCAKKNRHRNNRVQPVNETDEEFNLRYLEGDEKKNGVPPILIKPPPMTGAKTIDPEFVFKYETPAKSDPIPPSVLIPAISKNTPAKLNKMASEPLLVPQMEKSPPKPATPPKSAEKSAKEPNLAEDLKDMNIADILVPVFKKPPPKGPSKSLLPDPTTPSKSVEEPAKGSSLAEDLKDTDVARILVPGLKKTPPKGPSKSLLPDPSSEDPPIRAPPRGGAGSIRAEIDESTV